jgi:hypothetical protein
MRKFSHVLAYAALLLLGVSCSEQNEPAPLGGRSTSANNVAPFDPDGGGGGGGGGGAGGGGTCTPSSPSQTIVDRIKANGQRICRLNRWTIVTTITPPDGFTIGIGCPDTSYPFSVDIIDENGYSTYASGSYNCGSGVVTLSK